MRFVAQGMSQRATREAVREDGRSAHIQGLLDGLAKELAGLDTLRGGAVCAMLPTTAVNFVNLNAESYLAMLRTKVVEASGQKVRFLLPGTPFRFVPPGKLPGTPLRFALPDMPPDMPYCLRHESKFPHTIAMK